MGVSPTFPGGTIAACTCVSNDAFSLSEACGRYVVPTCIHQAFVAIKGSKNGS